MKNGKVKPTAQNRGLLDGRRTDGSKIPSERTTVEKLIAIYEVDFLPCSYGYRPGRGAHDAIKALTVELQFGKHQFVVEEDIKGYFDNIQWKWLERMLELRINAGALKSLIRKWLRAGVLEEDGKVIHPQTGTPQGGVVSPVLANIYLHYALDLWFEQVVQPKQRGRCRLIRYADDFVAGFEHRYEAAQFEKELVLLRQACCRLEKLDVFEVETGKVQPVSLVGKVC